MSAREWKDEFTRREKQWAYENNSESLEGEFPDETAFQKAPIIFANRVVLSLVQS
jgi:hypothetical protein